MRALNLTCVSYLIAALVLNACGKKEEGPETPQAQGRRVYMTYCVVCHNADPSKDGTNGPALAGSSEELLKTRVLTQSYPPGYKPKRPTQTMPVYPQVKNRISELTAFLNAKPGELKKDPVK